jgi:catechol 2,3-dioxygenase-like lactoylglutathione lyase family enzyme
VDRDTNNDTDVFGRDMQQHPTVRVSVTGTGGQVNGPSYLITRISRDDRRIFFFSEYRAGLEHFALGCATPGELEKWVARLDELGVPHGDIKDASYGSGVSFRDPDGIPLEFFAPPA